MFKSCGINSLCQLSWTWFSPMPHNNHPWQSWISLYFEHSCLNTKERDHMHCDYMTHPSTDNSLILYRHIDPVLSSRTIQIHLLGCLSIAVMIPWSKTLEMEKICHDSSECSDAFCIYYHVSLICNKYLEGQWNSPLDWWVAVQLNHRLEKVCESNTVARGW